jgi:hypothetical protein
LCPEQHLHQTTPFFEIDHFSMLTVIARAEVRSVSPVNSRICGGSSITLDGVNLRAVPIPSASASGSLFCKFGELYQKAEFIESRELRGFGEAVLCTTPCVTKAGFTSVEVHDASTLLSSASGLRILLSAPASVNAIAPPSGPGNSLAVIFGNRLECSRNKPCHQSCRGCRRLQYASIRRSILQLW